MKDKSFLDTNIFVYSFDSKDSRKQRIARGLIKDALDSKKGVISLQVAQEFLNVALKKFERPLTPDDSNTFMSAVLQPMCEVFTDFHLLESALRITRTDSFSFYDSLIVAAAEAAECKVLLSEDFQHGQKIGRLKIENPFL